MKISQLFFFVFSKFFSWDRGNPAIAFLIWAVKAYIKKWRNILVLHNKEFSSDKAKRDQLKNIHKLKLVKSTKRKKDNLIEISNE